MNEIAIKLRDLEVLLEEAIETEDWDLVLRVEGELEELIDDVDVLGY